MAQSAPTSADCNEVTESGPVGIPKRPSAIAAEQREREHRWRAMALFGVIAVGIAGYAASTSGDAPTIEPNSPELLAFAEGHEGHDHGDLKNIGNDDPDYENAELGGPVPEVIKENLRLPVGAEVVHVIVAEEGVWQFEGTLADGATFWKVVDLNRGLVFDAGDATNALPFP